MTEAVFGEDETSLDSSFIFMWSGNLSDIPSGYVIADGNNGSPDFRDKFVKGMSDYAGSKSTGGEHSKTLSSGQLPSHDHTGSVNNGGNHYHRIGNGDHGDWDEYQDGYIVGNWGQNNPGDDHFTLSTEGSHSHGSGYTDNAGGGASIDNRPQHYETVFLYKL